MRSETRHKIDEFFFFPWFKNVGRATADKLKSIHSWTDAMHHCTAIEWRSVQLQVNNHLASCVSRVDYSRFQTWNPTVEEINTLLAPLLREQITPVANAHQLGTRFEQAVSWDLMESCIETEFSDICEPVFFLEAVLPWYECGHFPCGWTGPKIDETWDGRMPEGKVIVF